MYKIIKFKQITSTNDYIKENYKQLENNTVVVGEKQTKGRGRLDHAWESPKGNLYFSVLLEGKYDDFTLIKNASLSVVKFLDSIGIKALIKYPNDILVDNKKIAGILIETMYTDQQINIIGIGLNVNQVDFKELNTKAISMKQISNTIYSLDRVLDNILVFLDNQYTVAEYKKYSFVLGRTILLNDKRYMIVDILDDGSLRLRNGDKFVTVKFNEISLEELYV